MTLPRPCHDDAAYPEGSSSPAEHHAREAFEQGARFAAALAIARWSGHNRPLMPARAAWLAQAHGDLGQWFDAGGFAQQTPAAPSTVPDDGAPLPFPGSRPRFYTLFRKASSTAD